MSKYRWISSAFLGIIAFTCTRELSAQDHPGGRHYEASNGWQVQIGYVGAYPCNEPELSGSRFPDNSYDQADLVRKLSAQSHRQNRNSDSFTETVESAGAPWYLTGWASDIGRWAFQDVPVDLVERSAIDVINYARNLGADHTNIYWELHDLAGVKMVSFAIQPYTFVGTPGGFVFLTCH